MNGRCACLRVCATTLCVGLLAAGTLRAAPADDDWDPPAIRVPPTSSHGTRPIDELIEEGRRLFVTAFNRHDGAGRPAATGDVKPTRRLAIATGFDRLSGPDASACVGCHNQPRAGGHGDYASTVFVASATRYAVATPDQGNAQALRRPPSLFGAGLLELLAREMTRDLVGQRDGALARARAAGRDVSIDLSAKGVRFGSLVARSDGSYDAAGVSGVDPDLVVRPFGWRGQAVSVREFTITALNQHHGI